MGLKVKIFKRLPGFDLEVSFSCSEGQLLALIGPSGAGKTTLVRIIAGLDRPNKGQIVYKGTVWLDTEKGIFWPPQKRKVGYVFQEYPLFPHLTIEKNVTFAATDKCQANELLKLFGIWHLRKRKPFEVSGGERQRAALAQALARKPKVLLLDEPFSALDVVTRKKLRKELKNLKGQLSLPILLVTHDLEEALSLADNLLPIQQGKIDQNWLAYSLDK